MKTVCVLTAAGSDPSGGAGIQADLKTFSAIGVYGCAVITGLTVQNTTGVSEIFLLPGSFVERQIKAVLDDFPVKYVKTGMIGNAGIAEAIGNAVKGLSIICDPVLVSTSGHSLFEKDDIEAFEKHIISKSRVLLPNYQELMFLSRYKTEDPVDAGRMLFDRYSDLPAILIKGGHINENGKVVTDILMQRISGRVTEYFIKHRRILSLNTHGTGCTLSSALTAFMALGADLESSARKAVGFTGKLLMLSRGEKLGKGKGPLLHYKI